MDKGNFEPGKESISKGQAFWGLLVFIGLMAAVVVWFSSLLSGDVMEATDYVSQEAVDAFKEVIVEEEQAVVAAKGTAVENLGAYTMEVLESAEGDWQALQVLDSNGEDAEAYGIHVDAFTDEIYWYFRIGYSAQAEGPASFFLPGGREGLKVILHEITQAGDNEWMVRLAKADWQAIQDMHGIDQLGLSLQLQAAETETPVFISMDK